MKIMLHSKIMIVFLLTVILTASLYAQEEEKKLPFSLGADVVSSYVWRGSKVGTGPNIQPWMKFSAGGFTLGAWGSTSFHFNTDVAEIDLYSSYTFVFGLTLGVTDYYYQSTPYFQFQGDTSSHAFEINVAYSIKDLSLSGNYIINDASNGGPANKPGGGDMYFEAAYAFKNFDVFLGAGNGWHTTYRDNGDDVFAVCNIGVKAAKELKITDKFSLPISGALSLNPDKEQLNLVIGISF